MAKAGEPNIVRAIESFAGAIGKDQYYIVKGETFEADHPAVRKWPQFFGPVLLRYPMQPEIEQATAAPGQKRGA